MTTTQSKEKRARLDLVTRIGRGHLTRDEQRMLAALVQTVGFHAEHHPDDAAENWRGVVSEYRRLVPEGGETA